MEIVIFVCAIILFVVLFCPIFENDIKFEIECPKCREMFYSYSAYYQHVEYKHPEVFIN